MYLAGYSAIDIVSGLIYALSLKLCLILKFSQTEGLYFYSYIERQLRQYAAAVMTPKFTLCSSISDKLYVSSTF